MFLEQHARPVLGAPAGAGCARPGRLTIGRPASPPAEGGEMDQERPLLAEAWLGGTVLVEYVGKGFGNVLGTVPVFKVDRGFYRLVRIVLLHVRRLLPLPCSLV